ncbi:serine/threonine-protein kinase [Streptomyces phaeoluteigriseus]
MNGVPGQIGRYVVERELGSGGMGEVYLAFSPAGDPVAVKLIRSDRLDPVARARFEKEALIARTVVGTNRVARFLDADPYAERPWLAMEYVPGQTLLSYADGNGPLSAPLVASLGALLAEGLQAVHAVGLLHRDLKPQNVMLGTYGPILIDFGLGAFLDTAKDTLSHGGMIIGTVRCMPPEQAQGRTKVKESDDVYGLGTVLLYAATGHYPYDGARWEAIVGQVANADQAPDPSGLPPDPGAADRLHAGSRPGRPAFPRCGDGRMHERAVRGGAVSHGGTARPDRRHRDGRGGAGSRERATLGGVEANGRAGGRGR